MKIPTLPHTTHIYVQCPHITAYLGVAVSGGEGALTNVEVYVPSTGLSCSLPPLPDDRDEHTMDSKYICGGVDTPTSCLHLLNGNVMVMIGVPLSVNLSK